MARPREETETADTTTGTVTSVGLYPTEKQNIQPGDMDWTKLTLLIKSMDVLQKVTPGGVWNFLFDDVNTKAIVATAEEINSMIRGWIDGYEANNTPRVAVLGFEYHWKIIRVWVSLQFRLAVEQVLYEKGQPWSDLVTGFGPVKARRLVVG